MSANCYLVSCFLGSTILVRCLFTVDFSSFTSSLIFLFSSSILLTVFCIPVRLGFLVVEGSLKILITFTFKGEILEM